NEAHNSELSALKAALDDERAEIQAEAERERAEGEVMRQEYETQVRERFNLQMQRERDNLTAVTDTLRHQLDEEREALQAASAEAERQMRQEAREEAETLKAAMKAELAAEVQRVEADQEKRVQAHEAQYEALLAAEQERVRKMEVSRIEFEEAALVKASAAVAEKQEEMDRVMRLERESLKAQAEQDQAAARQSIAEAQQRGREVEDEIRMRYSQLLSQAEHRAQQAIQKRVEQDRLEWAKREAAAQESEAELDSQRQVYEQETKERYEAMLADVKRQSQDKWRREQTRHDAALLAERQSLAVQIQEMEQERSANEHMLRGQQREALAAQRAQHDALIANERERLEAEREKMKTAASEREHALSLAAIEREREIRAEVDAQTEVYKKQTQAQQAVRVAALEAEYKERAQAQAETEHQRAQAYAAKETALRAELRQAETEATAKNASLIADERARLDQERKVMAKQAEEAAKEVQRLADESVRERERELERTRKNLQAALTTSRQDMDKEFSAKRDALAREHTAQQQQMLDRARQSEEAAQHKYETLTAETQHAHAEEMRTLADEREKERDALHAAARESEASHRLALTRAEDAARERYAAQLAETRTLLMQEQEAVRRQDSLDHAGVIRVLEQKQRAEIEGIKTEAHAALEKKFQEREAELVALHTAQTAKAEAAAETILKERSLQSDTLLAQARRESEERERLLREDCDERLSLVQQDAAQQMDALKATLQQERQALVSENTAAIAKAQRQVTQTQSDIQSKYDALADTLRSDLEVERQRIMQDHQDRVALNQKARQEYEAQLRAKYLALQQQFKQQGEQEVDRARQQLDAQRLSLEAERTAFMQRTHEQLTKEYAAKEESLRESLKAEEQHLDEREAERRAAIEAEREAMRPYFLEIIPCQEFAVQGHVEKENTGQDLEGVQVRAFPVASLIPLATTFTDANGDYFLDLIDDAGLYGTLRMEYVKTGFVTKDVIIDVPECGLLNVDVDLVVLPDEVIELDLTFVCENDGLPMGPGCEVTVCVPSFIPEIECDYVVAQGETDMYGKVTFDLPASLGEVVLVTIEPCDPFTDQEPEMGTLVGLPPVGSVEKTIYIRCDTIFLHGCVKSNVDGRPLVRAEVCATCEPDVCTYTDCDGMYWLDLDTCAERGDQIEVTASYEGHTTVTTVFRTDPNEMENELCFCLDCEFRGIRGLVLDHVTEEPVEEGKVKLYNEETHKFISKTYLNEDGTFELEIPDWVEPDTELRAVVYAYNYESQHWHFDAPFCGALYYRFELRCNYIRLCVTLTDENEDPLKGLPIRLLTDTQEWIDFDYDGHHCTNCRGKVCHMLPPDLNGHVVDVLAQRGVTPCYELDPIQGGPGMGCDVNPCIYPLDDENTISITPGFLGDGDETYRRDYPDCGHHDNMGGHCLDLEETEEIFFCTELGESLYLECGCNDITLSSKDCTSQDDWQTDFTFTVYDAVSGEPIKGATINISRIEPEYAPLTPLASGITDDFGVYDGIVPTFTNIIELGDYVFIEVVAENYYEQVTTMYFPEGCANLFRKFYMTCCDTHATGRVIDEHGLPVPFAEIIAWSADVSMDVDYGFWSGPQVAKELGHAYGALDGTFNITMIGLDDDEFWLTVKDIDGGPMKPYRAIAGPFYAICGGVVVGDIEVECTDFKQEFQYVDRYGNGVGDLPYKGFETSSGDVIKYAATTDCDCDDYCDDYYCKEGYGCMSAGPKEECAFPLGEYCLETGFPIPTFPGPCGLGPCCPHCPWDWEDPLNLHDKCQYEPTLYCFDNDCECPGREDKELYVPCKGTSINGFVVDHDGYPAQYKRVEIRDKNDVLIKTAETGEYGTYFVDLPHDADTWPYVQIIVWDDCPCDLDCKNYCVDLVYLHCGINCVETELSDDVDIYVFVDFADGTHDFDDVKVAIYEDDYCAKPVCAKTYVECYGGYYVAKFTIDGSLKRSDLWVKVENKDCYPNYNESKERIAIPPCGDVVHHQTIYCEWSKLVINVSDYYHPEEPVDPAYYGYCEGDHDKYDCDLCDGADTTPFMVDGVVPVGDVEVDAEAEDDDDDEDMVISYETYDGRKPGYDGKGGHKGKGGKSKGGHHHHHYGRPVFGATVELIVDGVVMQTEITELEDDRHYHHGHGKGHSKGDKGDKGDKGGCHGPKCEKISKSSVAFWTASLINSGRTEVTVRVSGAGILTTERVYYLECGYQKEYVKTQCLCGERTVQFQIVNGHGDPIQATVLAYFPIEHPTDELHDKFIVDILESPFDDIVDVSMYPKEKKLYYDIMPADSDEYEHTYGCMELQGCGNIIKEIELKCVTPPYVCIWVKDNGCGTVVDHDDDYWEPDMIQNAHVTIFTHWNKYFSKEYEYPSISKYGDHGSHPPFHGMTDVNGQVCFTADPTDCPGDTMANGSCIVRDDWKLHEGDDFWVVVEEKKSCGWAKRGRKAKAHYEGVDCGCNNYCFELPCEELDLKVKVKFDIDAPECDIPLIGSVDIELWTDNEDGPFDPANETLLKSQPTYYGGKWLWWSFKDYAPFYELDPNVYSNLEVNIIVNEEQIAAIEEALEEATGNEYECVYDDNLPSLEHVIACCGCDDPCLKIYCDEVAP
ncbi:hypothetical protein KIPB_001835, partial [Kipferlia bialata]